MSTTTQLRHCGECERSITKAHRIERDVAYCATCYSRVFIHKDCSRCGQTMRAHRYDTAPVCRSCRNQGRSCRRCGKSIGKKAGLIVGGQPICNACAPHFRVARPCTNCGLLSSRLSRAPHLGFDDLVCERCYRLDYATCGTCRKYRRVEKLDAQNKPTCRACSEYATTEHMCPGCGAVQMGTGNACCQRCRNCQQLEQCALVNVEMMEQAWCRDLFLRFCSTLEHRTEVRRLLSRLHRYALFFTMLDQNFGETVEITQDRLFQIYGADGLRRHQVVLAFLCGQNILTWHFERQEELIETRRIQARLDSVSHFANADLLGEYMLYLQERPMKNGRLRHLRTVRSCLTTASKFLEFCAPGSVTQTAFDQFCKKHRGLSASLSTFAGFLSASRSQEFKVGKSRRTSLRILEKSAQQKARHLFSLLRPVMKPEKRKAVLAALIAHLHGLRLADVLSIRCSQLQWFGSDLQIQIDGQSIILRSQVADAMRQVTDGDDCGRYLFENQTIARPISPSTVWYHTRAV